MDQSSYKISMVRNASRDYLQQLNDPAYSRTLALHGPMTGHVLSFTRLLPAEHDAGILSRSSAMSYPVASVAY